MKIVFTEDEVSQILLMYANSMAGKKVDTPFNDVEIATYSKHGFATVSYKKQEPQDEKV